MKRLCILALIYAQLNFGAASSSAGTSSKSIIKQNATVQQDSTESRRPRMLQPRSSGAASSSVSVESPDQSSSSSPHPNSVAYREYLRLKKDYKRLCSFADPQADLKITGSLELLQNRKTAARIESTILPGSMEFCDLKYAEYLAAQELITHQKSHAEQHETEQMIAAFSAAAAYCAFTVINRSLGDLFLESLPIPVDVEAAELIQEKVNQAYATYISTKRALDPDGYQKELETSFLEATKKLSALEAEKNNRSERLRLMRRNDFHQETIKKLQAELKALEDARQKALLEVQATGKTLGEAKASIKNHAHASESALKENRSKSIFSHSCAIGTLEHLQLSRIKFLGSHKLLQTIQRQNEGISRGSCYERIFPSNKHKASMLLERFAKLIVQQNRHNMKAVKVGLLTPDITEPFESEFLRQTNILQDAIALFLHPVLHGYAEPIPEDTFDKILVAIVKGYDLIKQEKFKKAAKTVFHILKDTIDAKAAYEIVSEGINLAVAYSNNAAISQTVRKILEKVGRSIPAQPRDKPAQGASSDQAMSDIKDGKKPILFQSWKPDTCPKGIEHCPRLGLHSKMILTAIKKFISNIKNYEKAKRLPYFEDPRDLNRILAILNTAISNIYETNIKSALNNKSCDDKCLKNTSNIIDFMSRLPLHFYNIDEKLKENKCEIDALLTGYTPEIKRGFYSWMRELRRKALQPDYGHTKNDTGVNLILVGPTGVGKTFITTELCKLLGLPVIEMTLKDLLAVSSGTQSVQELLRTGSLTPLENELSGLAKDASSLLILVYVDEASNDHGITDSQLKRYLCQFKKLFLPSLQIHLPTNLNLIMTCNKSSFIQTDPALAGRFIVIPFDELTPEAKIDRFLPKLINFFNNNALLKDKCKDLDFKQITTEYVYFDTSLNMRLLESRLSCVIDYFTQKYEKEAGNWHLFAPEDRNSSQETFQEFLARIFSSPSAEKTHESARKEKIDLLLPELIACIKRHQRYNPEHIFHCNQILCDYVEFDQNIDIETLTEKIPVLVDFLFANTHASEKDFQIFFAQLFNKKDRKVLNEEDDEAFIAQSPRSPSSSERSDEEQDVALDSDNDLSSSDNDYSCDISTASSSEHVLSSSSSGDSDYDYDTE